MNVAKQRWTFLSYSRKDKGFALELARQLKAAGYLVWLDQLDIPTGARWDDEVERALRESEIFLIILTPASISSENVKDEIGYAIDHGKRILPILMEECEVPLRLRRFQYVDFTKSEFSEGVKRAEQLLESFINERSTPLAPVKSEPEVQKTPISGSTATPSLPNKRRPSQRRWIFAAAALFAIMACLVGVGGILIFRVPVFRQMINPPFQNSPVPTAIKTATSTKTPVPPTLTRVNTSTATKPPPSSTLRTPTVISPTVYVSQPTWHQTTASLIEDVAVASDGTIWVAGQNGTIWFSSNQGIDFTQVDAGGFKRISVAPSGTVWAVGDNGTLWQFDGNNWTQTTASQIGDVAVASDGTIWVAGQNGTIWFSSNQGIDFTQVDASNFESVAAGSTGIWAVGFNGTLWYYQ